MAGTQTHGFDMAIEVSGQTLQNLLSATFDSDGFLGSLIPDNIGILDGFELDISFNRPSGIPPSASNPLELSFAISLTNGSVLDLVVAVGTSVDRTEANFDKVVLDFVNQLHKCEVRLNGVSNAITNIAANFIRNKLDNNNITILPIPVNRTSTNTVHITRADAKIIDDSSSANNDALAVVLTYGGGSAGDLNAFTEAFARAGAGAAVAINFNWICRNISPRIESGIGLPAGSFTGCAFNGSHEIRDGVALTSLSIRPADDHIVLSGSVAKSGFCYTASGTFTARVRIAIVSGQLRVSFETDNPNIDVDIPWYCWLAGAVIGAILGGVIFGLIGAIVGAIIIPLLLWITEMVVESVVENVTAQVTDSINNIEDIEVQLVGIDTVLDSAFIDDLTVSYDMYPKEYRAIQAEGVINLRNGDYLDLDNGLVKRESFGGADLRLQGDGQARTLHVLCGSEVADLNVSQPFDKIRHFHLLMLNYGLINPLPLSYFAVYIPLPFVSDDYYETGRKFAVKTSDGNYGFFQVIGINDSEYKVKYKIYKSNDYKIDLSGSFSCNAKAMFTDKFVLESRDYIDATVINKNLKTYLKLDAINLKEDDTQIKMQPLAIHQKAVINDKAISPEMHLSERKATLLKYNRAVGNWVGKYTVAAAKKTGKFVAKVNSTVEIDKLQWIVDGNLLNDKSSGIIKIKNQSFEYKLNGKVLTLSSDTKAVIEVPIRLSVLFKNGQSDYIIKCVPFKNDCKVTIREVPPFRDYAELFDKNFGTVIRPKHLAIIPS